MKTSLLFCIIFEFLFSSLCISQTIYVWNGATTDYQLKTNWTPTRNTLSTSDILKFNSGSSHNVTNIPSSQSIGQLIVESNTHVTFSTTSAINLTILGLSSGNDLIVSSGSSLNISGNAALNLYISTGATGSINGNISLSGVSANTDHRIIPTDVSSLVFNSGSYFTQGTFINGNIFSSTDNYNVVVFLSGSTFEIQSGNHPFGFSQPNSRVVFQEGSLYKHKYAATPVFAGRTYADFEFDVPSYTGSPTGNVSVSINNLKITNGTLNFNVTENPGHSIKGNINVASGGTLNFNPSSAGTVNINGTINQNIGNFSSNTFSTIVINNSNNINLNGNITIGGKLSLISGKIITGTNTLTLGTSATSLGILTLPASPSSSYIVGNFKRWIGKATGNNTYFPVGSSLYYNGILINYTTIPSSGGTLTAKYIVGDPGTHTPQVLNDAGYPVDVYGSQGYWKIDAADGLSGGIYTINLDVNGFNGVSDITQIRILKRTDNTTDWSVTGSTHSPGSSSTAKRNSMNGFSEFALGGYSIYNPLTGVNPVHISSFTSSTTGNNIKLNWTTQSEINNTGFEIERAEVGIQNLEFRKIGFVNGNGTKNTPTNYSFEDKNLQSGKYKYRLKQIDNNGNFEYHNLNSVIEVTLSKKFQLSQNYPNPFNPITKINFEIPRVEDPDLSGEGKNVSNISLIVYDVLGREVTTLFNGIKEPGYHTIEFDASSLSSGTYFYRLASSDISIVKKMLIIK